MVTAVKQASILLRKFSEKMALPNHGFTDVSKIERLQIPKFEVPKAEQTDRIYVKNLKHVKVMLRKMKREGLEQFKIVADFDQTLTKSAHNKRRVQASFGILKESHLISQGTRECIENSFRKYKKDENQPEPDKITKATNMDEWMSRIMESIVSDNIQKEELNKVLQDSYIVPRDQLDTFLQLGSKYQIPFYTVSAGISNIIATVLDHYVNLNEYPNFHIYANEMIFSDKGKLTEFSKPYIHSFTKDDIFQKNQAYRKNHLLIGDLLHDALTTKNIFPRMTMSIGFLNYISGYNVVNIIYDYARKYDIVIMTDESLAIPELITRYILDLESESTLFKYLEERAMDMDQARDYLDEVKKRVDAEATEYAQLAGKSESVQPQQSS